MSIEQRQTQRAMHLWGQFLAVERIGESKIRDM